MPTLQTPDAIVSYWFDGRPLEDEASVAAAVRFWFGGGPAVDREITERFGDSLAAARRGELASWTNEPRSRLALVLLLDQFSRNVHCGSGLAFAHDEATQKIVFDGVDAGHDRGLAAAERMFFYIPLSHAENLAVHDRYAPLVRTLPALATGALRGLMDLAVKEADRHRDTIVRFGRFPARNAAIGRPSTAEEKAYLDEEAAKQKARG